MALPHDDPDVDDLGDGIVADALIPDLHLLFGIWKIDGYTKIAKTIKNSFEVTEGRNFFSFPYDWRRDNRLAARKLNESAFKWLNDWRKYSGNKEAKLILIAHSMGGLVSRYFLECYEGWKITKALITFGTPYRGSLNALDGLANGTKKGPLDLSQMVREFTSMYQLLPIFKCYDHGSGGLVRIGDTVGIPNVDAEKAKKALAFHREIENAVSSNMNEQQYRDNKYSIYPVVGIAQETFLSGRLKGTKVEMLRTIDGKVLGGDGTVPRISAIPIELSDDYSSAMYAATKHGSLQNADPVITNLIGVLSGYSIDLGEFKAVPPAQVALEVEDVFFTGEPIVIRARPNRENVTLTVTLWSSTQNRQIASGRMSESTNEWQIFEIASLDTGAYRITITGTDVETAEDSFIVVNIGK